MPCSNPLCCCCAVLLCAGFSDGERHTGYMLFECVDFYMIRKQGMQAAEVRHICVCVGGGMFVFGGGG
jgi:hypothetical protein